MTERPEEREQQRRELSKRRSAENRYDLETRMGWDHIEERPEERDSLAEIEERHIPSLDPGICNEDRAPWPCDARTLINEVKEREERIAELERQAPEGYAQMSKALDHANAKRKQMEEALRELRTRVPLLRVRRIVDAALSSEASPSDTEEPR